jgi:hypothetical protein
MTQPLEVEPWREARLRCGIGHVQRGRVRMVQDTGYNSDGEAFLYPPAHDYDPKTCVVCGLIIWTDV